MVTVKASNFILKALDSLPVLCLFCNEQMNFSNLPKHQKEDCSKKSENYSSKQNKWEKFYKLTNLELLHLQNLPKLVDSFLSSSNFKNLKTLSIKKCPRVVAPSLSQLANLSCFFFHSQMVKRQLLVSLSSSSSLSQIAFTRCLFEDASSLSLLSKLPNLHTLALPSSSGGGLDTNFTLHNFSCLTLLNVEKTSVGDNLCKSLSSSPLTRMNFENTKVSGEGVRALLLKRSHKLKEVRLANCEGIGGEEFLWQVLPSLPSIEFLSLPQLDKPLHKFASKSLKRLHLCSPNKADFLNFATHVTSITKLCLHGTLTDDIVKVISENCRNVLVMDLFSSHFTNEGMNYLANMTDIKKLSEPQKKNILIIF